MTRVGRFLYLDWAQSQIRKTPPGNGNSPERIVASHNGYRQLGITHQREVSALQNGGWVINDSIIRSPHSTNNKKKIISASLHWLLPDWEWEFENQSPLDSIALHLHSPYGWTTLRVIYLPEVRSSTNQYTNKIKSDPLNIQLIRSGKKLFGSGEVSPIWGWVSPTYGIKNPALSLRVNVKSSLPIYIRSEWEFSE
jgi:hypothetical protein